MRAVATSTTNTNLRIALRSASRSGCLGRVDCLMEAANVSPFDQPKRCEAGLSSAACQWPPETIALLPATQSSSIARHRHPLVAGGLLRGIASLMIFHILEWHNLLGGIDYLSKAKTAEVPVLA
jgi:hypothetical protein